MLVAGIAKIFITILRSLITMHLPVLYVMVVNDTSEIRSVDFAVKCECFNIIFGFF